MRPHPSSGSPRLRVPGVALCALLLCAGCASVGPDYRRPATESPAAFKAQAPWRAAAPLDDRTRGPWWKLFADPVLDDLEARALAQSPDLQVMVARLDQARAALGWVEADQLPQIGVEARAGKERFSGNRPDQPGKVVLTYSAYRYVVPVVASYEVDLWGRVRRAREAAKARVESTLAAEQGARLSLTADVALAYFGLRTVDTQLGLQREAVVVRQRTRDIVRARVRGGLASEWESARSEADLAQSEAELSVFQRRRDELENALAVLVGAVPSDFKVPSGGTDFSTPEVPAGLPSDLLERRPDVAEAERELAARNAEIGVARAAYFPSIRLTGVAGFESARLDEIVRADSLIWSLFPSLSVPLVDGGRRKAETARAEAAYRENAARYRQRILVAFREVEDALSALAALTERSQALVRGGDHARKAVRLSDIRYRAGIAPLVEMLDSQRAQLDNAQAQAELTGQRLGATVGLIRALGGGWSADRLAAEPVPSRAGAGS